MPLLHDIQEALIDPGAEIGPILLKLRLLAARLGSAPLEDWVRHESEGYPDNVAVPEYRKLHVAHFGTWEGAFGGGAKNAPIPSTLIAHFAGPAWVNFVLRSSVASVDDILSRSSESGSIRIDRSDLIIPLQGNVYPDFTCVQVVGALSSAALIELKNAVRTRALELTIALEQNVPEAAEIALGPSRLPPSNERAQEVTNITNQIVHGNVTTVTNTGAAASVTVNVRQHSVGDVVTELTRAGITADDARAFAELLKVEKPTAGEPFGPRSAKWVAENVGKAVSGVWNMGVSAATAVLTEVAKRYYGLT